MWQCSECNYYNEDLDDACAKCGTDRNAEKPEQQPGAEAVPQVPQGPSTNGGQAGGETPLPAQPSDGASLAQSKAVTVLLVIACLLAIGATGYVAWQRGLIGNLIGEQQPPETVTTADEPDVWADAPPAPATFIRKAAKVRGAVDQLLEQSATTTAEFDENGRLTPAAEESLSALAKSGNALVWEYGVFEDEVVKANDPKVGEYAQFVRDNVQAAMNGSLEVLARAYAMDEAGQHPAYMLSDAYLQAAEQYSLLDRAAIEDIWARAAHARRQRELDSQYGEYYRQLSARLDALKEIHAEFNARLAELPPYTVRQGRLGKDARDLLDLLGELADKVQEMVVEFEEYKGTLSGLEQSDIMQDFFSQFESLAQTDHLYAFEEIYGVYKKDKELTHPVYLKVEEYYQFALEHWSEAGMRYQQIYTEAESEWVRMWAAD